MYLICIQGHLITFQTVWHNDDMITDDHKHGHGLWHFTSLCIFEYPETVNSFVEQCDRLSGNYLWKRQHTCQKYPVDIHTLDKANKRLGWVKSSLTLKPCIDNSTHIKSPSFVCKLRNTKSSLLSSALQIETCSTANAISFTASSASILRGLSSDPFNSLTSIVKQAST